MYSFNSADIMQISYLRTWQNKKTLISREKKKKIKAIISCHPSSAWHSLKLILESFSFRVSDILYRFRWTFLLLSMHVVTLYHIAKDNTCLWRLEFENRTPITTNMEFESCMDYFEKKCVNTKRLLLIFFMYQFQTCVFHSITLFWKLQLSVLH